KSNRNDLICFSPDLYRARNRGERFFNRIKQCRRVTTRYDKLAANYLALVQLAATRLWLSQRAYESTPQHEASAATQVRFIFKPGRNSRASLRVDWSDR